MNCPNFNIKEIRDEFNQLVEKAGGMPLTIEEFKNKDLRNTRTGIDDLAMQYAYRQFDKDNDLGIVSFNINGGQKDINLNDISVEESGIIDFSENGKWNNFDIVSNGTKLGYISVLKHDDKTVRIGISGLYDSIVENKNGFLDKVISLVKSAIGIKKEPRNSNAGKGIGSIAYEILAYKLKNEYDKELMSDIVRTEAAEKMWKKFEEQGKATVIGDGIDYYYKFNTTNTIKSENDLFEIEEYNKPWKDGSDFNDAKSFALKSKPNQKIELVKDKEDNYYSVHFKTELGALTKDEIQLLVSKVASAIPIGAKLSTWGPVTKGGYSGLERFTNEGFVKTKEERDDSGNIIPVYEKAKYVKDGVDFMFESTPGLESIGTREQYSEYLDSIFPESKVKDVVYHGTYIDGLQEFSLVNFGRNDGGDRGVGIYLSKRKEIAEYYGDNVYAAIINTLNPYNIIFKDNDPSYYFGRVERNKYSENIIQAEKDRLKWVEKVENNDTGYAFFYDDNLSKNPTKKELLNYVNSTIDNRIKGYNERLKELEVINKSDAVINENYEIIIKPEQTHILGSKEDIEGFKEFVNGKETKTNETSKSVASEEDILFQRGINNELGYLSWKDNKEIYEDLGLLNKEKNGLRVFSYQKWGKDHMKLSREVVTPKRNRKDVAGKYLLSIDQDVNGKGYVVHVKAIEQDPLTKGQMTLFQRTKFGENAINGAEKSNSFKTLGHKAKKLLAEIANQMSKRFGVSFEIVSEAQAKELLAIDKDAVLTALGFYSRKNKKAYLIEGKFDESTAVHEIFGHPFLDMLKSSDELKYIYNALAAEAFKNEAAVKMINALYSDKSTETRTDELILLLLSNSVAAKYAEKNSRNIIKQYTQAFFQFIKNLFNKNASYNNINIGISIENLANYIVYGKGEINLLANEDKAVYKESVEKIFTTFGNKEVRKMTNSILNISEAIGVYAGDYMSMVHGYISDNGCPNITYLKNGLLSMANTVNDGKVIDPEGNIIGEYILDGNTVTVDNKNANKSILSILNSQLLDNKDSIFIKAEDLDSMFEHLSESLPYQCLSRITLDGVEYIVYSKYVRELYSPVLDVDFQRVPSSEIHESNVSDFISKISEGMKAQLHSLERKPDSKRDYLDKIRKLIEDIDSYDELDVMLKFIDHAKADVDKVVKEIDIANEAMTRNEDIDAGMLNRVRRNFLTLYRSTFDVIAKIRANKNSSLNTLTEKHLAEVNADIDAISEKLISIEAAFGNIEKYAYANKLIEIGEDQLGSPTIAKRFKLSRAGKEISDFYIDKKDVGLLHTMVGNALFSGAEQVRILDSIVSEVNASVAMAMETDGVLADLYAAWKNVLSHGIAGAKYSDVMEHDEKGHATGYILHELKYGKFFANYSKFMDELKAKYGLADEEALPQLPEDRRSFLLEKDELLSKHTERLFTPEYYKLRKSLSPETAAILEDSETAIRNFTNKFRDKNGKVDTRKMTPKDKSDLFYLTKKKRLLSMTVMGDGTVKPEGSMEYNMAMELQEFHKKLEGKINYRPNDELFEAAKTDAKNTMTNEEFAVWLQDNTKQEIDQSFYKMLENLDRVEQNDEYNRLSKIRSQLISLYRDTNSGEVSVNRIKHGDFWNNTDVLNTIKRIDIRLNQIRVSNKKSGFRDIAEIVPTREYEVMKEYLLKNMNTPDGVAAYDKWHEEAHYIDDAGRLNRYSYYSKIVPKDKRLIKIVPSSIWSEIDETSPFYNKNYRRDLAEYGLQPKQSLYDNSKEYNKMVKKPGMLEFRDTLIKSYKKANENYSYLPNPTPLRLAQIPGGFLHKVVHGSDGFLSGIKEAISDEFHYIEYDQVLGDYGSKDKYYADGSPVLVVPTRFRKMLDNPNQISRDLMLSFATYYKAALNFSKMNERVDDIELLLEGIKKTQILDKKGGVRKAAGQSNMYQKALKYVNSEVYGRDMANLYEITYNKYNVFKKLSDWLHKRTGGERVEEKYGKVSLSKPIISRFYSLVRIVNLSKNVKAAFGNLAGAAVHSKIEATCGVFMTNKTYKLAGLEVARNTFDIAESVIGRSDNKLISLMRFFAIGRSNENDMKNMHGSKLGRAIVEHIWYGEYSAGDFAVKSHMLVATLYNVKPYKDPATGKYVFYQREQFISKFYPNDRVNGERLFDSISENLYGAFEVKDGVLQVADKYKTGEYEGSVSKNTLVYVGRILGTLARTLDGSLTGVERSSLHRDVFGAALLLHRNYLLWAVQERFHGEMFRYDKGMMATGMYRADTFKRFPDAAFRIIMSNMTRALSLGFYNNDFGYKNKYTANQIYNIKRLISEYMWFIILSFGAIMVTKSIGDDKDKRKKSLEMWAYILLLRVALEVGSLSSPLELWNLQKNPSAAQNFFQAMKDIYDMFSDGTYDNIVPTGVYKNKTKFFRSATQMTPIWRNVYKSFIEPDLRNDERFIKSNVGSTYDLLDRIVYPDDPRLNGRNKKGPFDREDRQDRQDRKDR